MRVGVQVWELLIKEHASRREPLLGMGVTFKLCGEAGIEELIAVLILWLYPL